MASRLVNSLVESSGQKCLQIIQLPLVIFIFCLCLTMSIKLSAAQTVDTTEVNTTTETDFLTDNLTDIVTEFVDNEPGTTLSTTVETVEEYTAEETTQELTTESDLVTETVTDTLDNETGTVLNTTVDTLEELTTEESTPELITDLPGSTFVIRFNISNKDYDNIKNQTEREELERLLVQEFKELFIGNKKLKSVTVSELRNGSIIADVKLEFKEVLNIKEREEVIMTLFEQVVLNGTLGAFEVEDLKLVSGNGEVMELNNACDVRPCLQTEMKCMASGIKCTASCSDNKGYCLNNSTCQESNDYIQCKCKKGFFGYRCDKKPLPPSGGRDDNAYIGIIAAAGIAVVLLLVMIIGCGYNRLVNRGKECDTSKLFPAENSVALEMLDEPPPVVGGVACQTIESFLLTKYMKHGVPPKPGFQHEIVQTNESFLLAKAQREREAAVNNVPASSTQSGNGASPPPTSAPTPVGSTEQDCKTEQEKQPSTEPKQGISNKAFVEDECDIVPTAEVTGEEAKADIGKKIIKV
ncbi:uncharacterized protein LOC110985625 [Acanthaster planci]|uniref:Uncharacterized protein LOC110985625 n=1 Tax=Acanthaster planci TaxID=133434 RepID=A0A8B7Z9X2_ACAPL|nr:uncharacterized protein LOC110985625 [Acanthaster planci]